MKKTLLTLAIAGLTLGQAFAQSAECTQASSESCKSKATTVAVEGGCSKAKAVADENGCSSKKATLAATEEKKECSATKWLASLKGGDCAAKASVASNSSCDGAKPACPVERAVLVASQSVEGCATKKTCSKATVVASQDDCCATKAKTVASKDGCCAAKAATVASEGGCEKSKATLVADGKAACTKDAAACASQAKTVASKDGCCAAKAATVASEGGCEKSKATLVAGGKACTQGAAACAGKATTVANGECSKALPACPVERAVLVASQSGKPCSAKAQLVSDQQSKACAQGCTKPCCAGTK